MTTEKRTKEEIQAEIERLQAELEDAPPANLVDAHIARMRKAANRPNPLLPKRKNPITGEEIR